MVGGRLSVRGVAIQSSSSIVVDIDGGVHRFVCVEVHSNGIIYQSVQWRFLLCVVATFVRREGASHPIIDVGDALHGWSIPVGEEELEGGVELMPPPVGFAIAPLHEMTPPFGRFMLSSQTKQRRRTNEAIQGGATISATLLLQGSKV